MSGELSKHVRMRVREAERFAVSVMSQLRLQDGSYVDALICNLSEKGFMINSPDYLPEGSTVRVVIPGAGSCDAVIVWSFCGDTGARFTKPIDMDRYWAITRPSCSDAAEEPVSASEHLGQYFERGAERINAEGTFGLSCPGFHTVDAEIRDISSLGLKGVSPEPLLIGSIVELDIPGVGTVEAEVKWELGGHFGAMFTDPIDLRTCEWTAVRAKFAGH